MSSPVTPLKLATFSKLIYSYSLHFSLSVSEREIHYQYIRKASGRDRRQKAAESAEFAQSCLVTSTKSNEPVEPVLVCMLFLLGKIML